jgi:hypothetical protein
MVGADVALMCQVRTRLFWEKKNRVLELVRYEAKCSTVGTVVGEMTATKQHTAPWEKSTKNIQVWKKIPLSPQVHTADVPRDL